MQLALKGFRKHFQTTLVCQYPKYDGSGREVGKGQFKLSRIGEKSPDLDNRAAYAVLSKYGDMLEEVRETTTSPAAPQEKSASTGTTFGDRRRNKRATSPENK